MFVAHFQRNINHDRLHQDLRSPNITYRHHDRSCIHCYPPELLLSDNFSTFWDWYSSEYPAITYTRYTQQYLEELSYVEGEDIWIAIIDLIFSIRYSDTPILNFEALQQEIWNVYSITQGFRLDLFIIAYNYSEIKFSTSPGSEEIVNNNPQPIAQQPDNMAQPNQQDFQQLRAAIAALTQALPNTNNALAGNTQAITNPPRREGKVAELPYFYGGNQDPVAWLEDFTRACNANGIANGRKLEVVPAYLKGADSTWWNANQALPNNNPNKVVAWTGNNNNTDFVLNFPAAFRTQTLIEIWTTELEQKRQQPGEDVNTYAAALQELYRRVETNAFVYPEAIKARKFVNGLLPDLYVTVKPHNDQTWNAAVDRAKAYELTHQDQHAVSAYLNKFAPSGTNTQSEDLCKAIQELTKQVQQLGSRNRGYRNNNNQRNAAQPNNQAQQNPAIQSRVTCYSCGQP
ncbi:hypothetical protein RhiirA1_473076 [Rhizophagus irregularis]|uniref:Uncharacterized protein n=1 Tax=Rhizophagus irregularis TaxID=588596 RepID=A0A2N0R184_9GLOM|nr:hypothetical protein RhiirA1_473076 [Rhizophagus irregularis]